MSPEHKVDIAVEGAKAAPAITVAAAHKILGMDLNEAVAVATLIYIGLQCAWLVYKWWRASKLKNWHIDD